MICCFFLTLTQIYSEINHFWTNDALSLFDLKLWFFKVKSSKEVERFTSRLTHVLAWVNKCTCSVFSPLRSIQSSWPAWAAQAATALYFNSVLFSGGALSFHNRLVESLLHIQGVGWMKGIIGVSRGELGSKKNSVHVPIQYHVTTYFTILRVKSIFIYITISAACYSVVMLDLNFHYSTSSGRQIYS